MDAKELLEPFRILDPVSAFKIELLEVWENSKTHELLNPQTVEIGLLLVDALPGLPKSEHRWQIIEPIVRDDERYRRLEKLIPVDGFARADLRDLLIYFFGADKAALVAAAWRKIRFQMYQTGYARRSFRAPENRDLYFINQLNFLVGAIPQTFLRENYPSQSINFYDLTVAGQIRFSQFFYEESFFRVWAAAIDADETGVFEQIENIIFNRDDIGKVTRAIIKACLNSEKIEAWQLIEKLLLAAQRQEGLRQTILESLDETSVGALKFLLEVIVKNKLTRFSSVVRAVDVWAGLNWESERETTVKKFLEKAHFYLTQPEKIADGTRNIDNADVYMALWAQGVLDAEQTAPLLREIYRFGNAEKRSLALKFAAETKHREFSLPIFYDALNDADLLVIAWALQGINGLLAQSSASDKERFHDLGLFERLHELVRRVDSKEKTYEGKIFAWTKISFNRNEALAAMIELVGANQNRLDTVLSYFDEMNVRLRQSLVRLVLPKFGGYSSNDDAKNLTLSKFQHDFAFRLLSDRGEYIVSTAFRALENEAFSDAEMDALQNLLKRKGANFRGSIIKLLLTQTDEKLLAATAQLTRNGDSEQRLAGLDILLQLKKNRRLPQETAELSKEFQIRKNISPKEAILIEQIVANEDSQNYSAANGYGIFNPAKSVSPIVAPEIRAASIYEKLAAQNEFGFSVPVETIKNELEKLAALYLRHQDYEYEVENYGGERQTVLLGNTFRERKKLESDAPREQYENYPLPEVWEKWFVESKLQPSDLFLIRFAETAETDLIPEHRKIYEKFVPPQKLLMPGEFSERQRWNNPILDIINALRLIFPFVEKNEFALGGAARMFASLDVSVLKNKIEYRRGFYYSQTYGDGWQSSRGLNCFFNEINFFEIGDDFVKDAWNLAHWRQFSGLPENAERNFPPLILFCRAFELKIIGADELLRGLLKPEAIRVLLARKLNQRDFAYFERFPFLREKFDAVREHLLNIELKRGDSATAVTELATSLQKIFGINRFAEILTGLGKTPLSRGYSYYGDAGNKQSLFSKLLKISFPLETDSQADFDAAVKRAKIGEIKLIEAAVYAPQWQKFISRHLNWKGLDAAIWWMHAHTKNTGRRETNAEAESEIARYSSIDLQDFADGAVDKNWFLAAFKEIGKTRWAIIYDAAKFISDGNGHRRARLYADVISGAVKLKEISEKVKEKRDQDYLRMYGLAPLSKTNAAKDVLNRYVYLQKFKKESKQFGAQKQASETTAMRIALENLARNAGYSDPLRLTWAMETQQAKAVLAQETSVEIEGVSVALEIDADGKADLKISKNGKTLKSLPPQLKKNQRIIELTEHKKTLKDQFARSRQSLEEAMTRRDEFTRAELENLFAHPVISKHLEKLIFVAGDKLGFLIDNALVAADDVRFELKNDESLRIAHCVDLYNSGKWSDYQRICFERNLKQPFKQIFRELYLPTPDELREKSVSRRYAGHQIQPRQTVALLKTRGWKVDYETGLQKVFHREGFAAKMYALADWFSPAEVESPTLETVVFESLKDFKKIDFDRIDSCLFSEVMRDIDLIVSVAHAGGVDPEASHSTVEMRRALLTETVRLFRLENVSIGENHVKITGKMGEYSVHLGSATVHQLPGKYLSVLPVQAQQRGRIFLPFADDDPKSAEVVSKVLLFARDHEIQDPTILRQLN